MKIKVKIKIYTNMLNFNQYSLLETKLSYSSDFQDRISSIDSKITDFLFDIIDGDYDNIIGTDIDVTDKNDTVTFIPKAKFDSNKKSKTEIKIGRLIKGLSDARGYKFTDKEIENFVNQYKSIPSIDYRFEIWSGEKLLDSYDQNKYNTEREYSGELHNSCMNNEMEFLQLYVRNPKVVSTVVMIRHNEKSGADDIWGRALVWNTDQDIKFMDRVYMIIEEDKYRFHRWAKANEIYYKAANKSTTDIFAIVQPDGVQKYTDLSVTISDRIDSYDYYPYVDSFKYGQNKSLYTSKGFLDEQEESGNIYVMKSTEGDADIIYPDSVTDINGNPVQEEACIYSDYNSAFICVEDLDDYQHLDYHCDGRHIEDYIPNIDTNTDFVFSKDNGKWYFKRDCVWSDIEERWIMRDDALYINGDYIHTSNMKAYYDSHPELKNPFKSVVEKFKSFTNIKVSITNKVKIKNIKDYSK